MDKNIQRLMGLDVGDKRVGIALTDPLGITSQPHSTVENFKKTVFKEIAQIARDEGVVKIVVGIPYELDGSIGPQADKVCRFIDKLERVLAEHLGPQRVEIIEWDERFSTQEAKRIVVGSKLKGKDQSAALDRVSAAIILDSYQSGHFLPS